LEFVLLIPLSAPPLKFTDQALDGVLATLEEDQ